MPAAARAPHHVRATRSPDTHDRLVLPHPALAACIRGTMVRNTLGATLSDAQRFNHFPASPLCSLTWWYAGHSELLASGQPATLATPRAILPPVPTFSGPFTRPTVSWNPGPGHGMMVLMLPDALHRLTGVLAQDWVNQFVDAREVLPADWHTVLDAVQHAPDDSAGIACLEDFLAPRWAAARPTLPIQAHRYVDWAQSLALHAATSGPGRSLRQVERRIKRWAGLPLRELRGIGRAEQTFFAALAHVELHGEHAAPPNWAEFADANGYADQSHLCRESRRVTGFSPDELFRRIRDEESFWAYRLWQ